MILILDFIVDGERIRGQAFLFNTISRSLVLVFHKQLHMPTTLRSEHGVG